MCGHVTDGTNLKEKGILFEQPPKEISEMLKVLKLANEKKVDNNWINTDYNGLKWIKMLRQLMLSITHSWTPRTLSPNWV